MSNDRRHVPQPVVAAVIMAAIAGVAAPLQAAASRELVVSVQVVRRCAVSTSAPEPQNGDLRVVAVETTCGNAARVMVDVSRRAVKEATDAPWDSPPIPTSESSEPSWPSALGQTGEPLYLHPPALPHGEGNDRDQMTVLTVNF